jgi:hypothetical protein
VEEGRKPTYTMEGKWGRKPRKNTVVTRVKPEMQNPLKPVTRMKEPPV